MAELKITTVVGPVDQFQAEGSEDTVIRLLGEWRARNDALRTEAMATYDRMIGSGSVPPGPTTPRGGPSVSPFTRRTS